MGNIYNKYCLIVVIFLLITPHVSSSKATTYTDDSAAGPKIHSFSTANSPFLYTPPAPKFPSYGVAQITSKVRTSVSSKGMIGENIYDPISKLSIGGFEFPARSNNQYLWEGGFWFGGVVDDDTLVTVGYSKESFYSEDAGFYGTSFYNEFAAPLAHQFNASSYNITNGTDLINQTTIIDTITDPEIIIDYWYWYDERHRPLNIKVTLNSFSRNISPFKNIVLLDYIITNKSEKTINDAYAAIYLDEDIRTPCNLSTGYLDDLAGSLRDYGTIYCIDNGDLATDISCGNDAPTGAIALRPLLSYPPAADTNFNWWISTWIYDFGPRKKGTLTDPFRSFGDSLLGTPTGDANKYYMMSHPEWDYDQYLTNIYHLQDTTWMTPPPVIAEDIYSGHDTRTLLSIGPYTLLPDSSVRVIFALFGGDLIHLYPDNIDNLRSNNHQLYYDNLYFDILIDNINLTDIMLEEYISPLRAPSGLSVEYQTIDSVELHWTDYILPAVTSYNIYLKEIPDSLLLSSLFLRPDISFESIPTIAQFFNSPTNSAYLPGIDPAKRYAAVITQNSAEGESSPSNLILINADNPFTIAAKVTPTATYFPINSAYNKVALKWTTQESEAQTKYYKIYRSKDSLDATMRHYPFLHDDRTEIPFPYREIYSDGSKNYYYYYRNAYDSTESDIRQYIDSLTGNGYYYWVSSVNEYGRESEFTPLLQSVSPPQPDKNILVVLGATGGEQDYAYEDSISQYYYELLDGYNYDLYFWGDSQLVTSNCPYDYCIDWTDLAKYRLILVEEFPAPRILKTEEETINQLFTRLADMGRNIVYFGIPSSNESINLSTFITEINYDPTKFEHKYMGLSKTFLQPWFGNYSTFEVDDTLGGFTSAIPTRTDLPELHVLPYNRALKPFFHQLYNTDNNLPFTATFDTCKNVEVLYTYNSLYPETSLQQNQPVGIHQSNEYNHVYTFGFHLWGIEPTDAKQLVNYLFEQVSSIPPSYTLPNNVLLHQSYPNPFNGETNIPFSLPEPTEVTLEIYNILGQKIKTLAANKPMDAGEHAFKWNGDNDDNTLVATGIYFYKLTAGEITNTKKMLLLK